MSLEEEVLRRIETERIRPIPKWVARSARLAVLVGMVLALLLGSLSMAIAMDRFAAAGGGAMPHRGFREVLFGLLPWIVGAAGLAFSWLGWWAYRRTPLGHRRSGIGVVLRFVLASMVVGYFLHERQLLFHVHRTLAISVPGYRDAFRARRDRTWSDPKAGRLSGRSLGVRDGVCRLVDADQVEWSVTGTVDTCPAGEDLRFRGTAQAREFRADRQMPLGMGGGMERHGPGCGAGPGEGR